MPEMTIQFPNQSRCYDPARQCVRFSGHDSVFEILFFVEDEALSRMNPGTSKDEVGFLSAFDANRDHIVEVAAAPFAYARIGYIYECQINPEQSQERRDFWPASQEAS
jgi:hypothetical protein